MKLPISPHVTIYKFPVTALSSISTRVSGSYLTTVYLFSGIGLLSGIDLKEKYNKMPKLLKHGFNYSCIVPMCYHTFSGIRHFIWDKYPSLLNNKHAAKSSYVLFGSTIMASVIIEKGITTII